MRHLISLVRCIHIRNRISVGLAQLQQPSRRGGSRDAPRDCTRYFRILQHWIMQIVHWIMIMHSVAIGSY